MSYQPNQVDSDGFRVILQAIGEALEDAEPDVVAFVDAQIRAWNWALRNERNEDGTDTGRMIIVIAGQPLCAVQCDQLIARGALDELIRVHVTPGRYHRPRQTRAPVAGTVEPRHRPESAPAPDRHRAGAHPWATARRRGEPVATMEV